MESQLNYLLKNHQRAAKISFGRRWIHVTDIHQAICLIRSQYTEILEARVDDLDFATFLLGEAVMEFAVHFPEHIRIKLVDLLPTPVREEAKGEDFSQEYEVQCILDHHSDDQGDWFLVQWIGYEEPTWEPADNLYPNASDMVHEYFKNKN
jgi:hypothetical protein